MELFILLSWILKFDKKNPMKNVKGDVQFTCASFPMFYFPMLDFIHRLRCLSSRLLQQGFKLRSLFKSFNKFFKSHGTIIGKYDATLRDLRSAVHG